MIDSNFKHRGALGTLVWITVAIAIIPFTLVAMVMIIPAEIFVKRFGSYEEFGHD